MSELEERIKKIESDLYDDYHNRPRLSHFSLEGHWQPWYDDRRDYNTNAPSYYDYLARFNRFLRVLTDTVNLLLRRNIRVSDTKSVDLTKENDWESHDVINIKADVKISSTVDNGITVKNDGLWSKDFSDEISAIQNDLTNIRNQITSLQESNSQIQQTLSNLQDQIDDLSNKVNTNTSDITNLKKSISTINSSITNINNQITDIKNMVNTLKFMSSGQPPYTDVMADYENSTYIRRNSNPNFPKRQGVGIKIANVQYETDTVVNRTTWLQINLGELEFTNVTPGALLGRVSIDKLRTAGIQETMITGIERFTRLIGGITVNQRPVELLLSKVGNEIEIKYLGGFMQGNEAISGTPRVENSNPWIQISENSKIKESR